MSSPTRRRPGVLGGQGVDHSRQISPRGSSTALSRSSRPKSEHRLHGPRDDAGHQRFPGASRRARAPPGDRGFRRRLSHRSRESPRGSTTSSTASLTPLVRARTSSKCRAGWIPTGTERAALDEAGRSCRREEVQAGGVRRDRRGVPFQLREPRSTSYRQKPSFARSSARTSTSRCPIASRGSGGSTSAPRPRSSTPIRDQSSAATSNGSSRSFATAD